jgi:hypothetical protein
VRSLEGTLPAHADGETLCVEGQRLAIELLAGQLEVIAAGPGPRHAPSTEGAA